MLRWKLDRETDALEMAEISKEAAIRGTCPTLVMISSCVVVEQIVVYACCTYMIVYCCTMLICGVWWSALVLEREDWEKHHQVA